MNLRKGFRRLAVVYFALWISVGVFGWWDWDAANKQWLYVSDNAPNHVWDAVTLAQLSLWEKEMTYGTTLMTWAFYAVVIIPIGAAFFGGLAWWVWRGFREADQPPVAGA